MESESHTTQDAGGREALPLSLVNDYLYCARRAGLKIVEGWREENIHTVLGELAHEHADLPGYEVAKGVKVLRALPVFSERLGLSGKCDIVEVDPHPACGHPLPSDGRGMGRLCPVEYKKGKRRRFENDDAQLCAQGLCLEEMFGAAIERGAVFHAASKRRREVVFTPELRRLTEEAVAGLRRLFEQGEVPKAVFRPACEECSLYEVCLPQVTSQPARVAKEASALFET